VTEGDKVGNIFAYGYGTTVGELEFRTDASRRLFDKLSDKRAKKFVREWKKNYSDMEWDDCLTVMLLSDGPEKLLAEIINEDVFDGRKVVIGEKGALYVDLALPRKDGDRDAIPTEKEARDAIADYLGVCYKGVRKRDIDYYFFEEDED